MATIAEFVFDAETFPLGRLFRRLPHAEIELERLVPTTDATFPYFWVRDVDVAEVVPAIGDQEAIENVELVDSIDGDGLFRARWNLAVPGVIQAITESGITLLSASATNGGWTFEFRAPDPGTFTRFQRYCVDHDIDFRVKRLHSLSETDSAVEHGMTEAQREALLLAYDRGYFDEPRRTTLEALADELGITRQSLAGRLRRGHRHLIADTLRNGTI